MTQIVYVLQLKTWAEYDRAHHTYGRIHWETEDGFESADSVAEPDADGYCTIRHDTRDGCIAGARRWFAINAVPGSALVLGRWGLAGWEYTQPYEVLEGVLMEVPDTE